MPLLDKLREQYGVGPLCSELHIAPSTYYHCQQQRHHPDKRSARAQRDDWLKKEIQRVYDENHKVYGVRKVWRQLLREGIRVARCTVARLMAVMGLAGVLRGKKVRTTISRKAVAAGDRVNRQFVAERPDQLWVADVYKRQSVNSGCQIIVSDGSIISFFCFCRRSMAQPFQQSSIVIPVHPRECGQFHFCTVFPALTVYYLRFVKTIDALRHRVVIRVACTSC